MIVALSSATPADAVEYDGIFASAAGLMADLQCRAAGYEVDAPAWQELALKRMPGSDAADIGAGGKCSDLGGAAFFALDEMREAMGDKAFCAALQVWVDRHSRIMQGPLMRPKL